MLVTTRAGVISVEDGLFEKQKVYRLNHDYLNVPELKKDSEEAIIPQMEVVSFKDAVVTPINHVFINGRYKPTGLFNTYDNKKLTLLKKIFLYTKFRFFTPVVKLNGTFLFAHDIWSDNYYHWLTEVLPRIYLMTQKYNDAIVILPSMFYKYSFITNSLELLDIKVKWIESNISYRYSNLITVITTPPVGHVDPQLQGQLISGIFKKLNINLSEIAKRKIFVSRAKARRRFITNETELSKLLVDNGYEIIYIEDMSFLEQVKLFSNTASLISLHGAGLTNLVFMPPGSKVLEIRDENWETNELCFWRLSNVLNIKWSCHLGTIIGERSNFSDISINYKSFAEDLKEFENY